MANNKGIKDMGEIIYSEEDIDSAIKKAEELFKTHKTVELSKKNKTILVSAFRLIN